MERQDHGRKKGKRGKKDRWEIERGTKDRYEGEQV